MRHRLDGYTLASIDLLTALVVVFAAMAVLSLLAAEKQSKSGVHPGVLIVTMRWDMARNADVDLWVREPGGTVGYSRTKDADCDLLRDDLGRALDPSSRNQEMVVCRRAPAGEWVVDTMLYRSYDRVFPVAVTVAVERLGDDGADTLIERHVSLAFDGDQITAARFSLDAHTSVVQGSVGCVPVALYVGMPARCQ